MGWKKEIARDDNGATAEHWEVISVFYNHKDQTSTLEVGGWVNQSAYESNLEPLISKSWNIPAGSSPELAQGAVMFVTTFAKSQPEFEGWT